MKSKKVSLFSTLIIAKCILFSFLCSCEKEQIAQPNYLLSLKVNPVNAGEVTGEGYYVGESQVTVSAAANQGYEFINWTNEDDNIVSSEASFAYTMSSQNTTLTANFKTESLSFTPTSAPRGDVVTISFSGGNNFTFTQASNTCPEIYANAKLYFNQGSPTTIYPDNIYFHNSKNFDAVFNIPSGVPVGHYDVTVGYDTQCAHTEYSAFEIY